MYSPYQYVVFTGAPGRGGGCGPRPAAVAASVFPSVGWSKVEQVVLRSVMAAHLQASFVCSSCLWGWGGGWGSEGLVRGLEHQQGGAEEGGPGGGSEEGWGRLRGNKLFEQFASVRPTETWVTVEVTKS